MWVHRESLLAMSQWDRLPLAEEAARTKTSALQTTLHWTVLEACATSVAHYMPLVLATSQLPPSAMWQMNVCDCRTIPTSTPASALGGRE